MTRRNAPPRKSLGDYILHAIWDQKEKLIFTSSKPYTYHIAEGHVSGKTSIRRFGHNEDVGATWETLYHESNLYVYLTEAERLQVASTDADDDGDPEDTGARTLFIQGLDTNYAVQSETVTLNGSGNVLTAKSYIRIFKARVATAGTTGTNEGDITVSNNADDNVLASIPTGEGESHAAIFTVPAGQTAYITRYWGSELTNKGAHFGLFIRPFEGAWSLKQQVIVTQSPFEHSIDFPLKFLEKTDIEVRAYGAAVEGEADGGFEGWRQDN